GAEQLHRPVIVVGVVLFQCIQAADDVLFGVGRHVGLRVTGVHGGDVIELVDLFLEHAAHAVVDDDRQFVGAAGIVGAAIGHGGGDQVIGAVLVLQAF